MIISFINQKGGVGKTTLAFNFAYFISRRKNEDSKEKNRVLFIDTDPQQSAYNFLLERTDMLPFDIKAQTINDFSNFDDEYDFVIIDTGGFDSEQNRSVIRLSDKVILATQVSRLDIKSTYHIIDILKENRALGYETQYYLLFNKVVGKDALTDTFINQVVEDVKDSPVIVLQENIKHSVDYNKAELEMQSIFECEGTKRGLAAASLRKVIMEIMEWKQEK